MNEFNEIKIVAQQDDNIINLYLYGSHVYGTNNAKSDIDMIAVVNAPSELEELKKYGDVNIYTSDEFKRLISSHEITVLECLFLPEDKVLKQTQAYEFNLDKVVLRNAISAKASNSWVKCKKKLTVEKDYNEYIGKKSAWHALRILDFGTQIATQGKITNYAQLNDILPKIMELKTWQEVDDNFRATYNATSSAFKLVAPKEITSTIKPKM